MTQQLNDDRFTSVFPSPVGPLGIITKANTLISITVLPRPAPIKQAVANSYDSMVANEITRYFENPNHPIAINLAPQGTAFQLRVWQALKAIPQGKTHTYGELANVLKTHARAIGQACRRNPLPIVVPCHRIIARTHLGGYAGETSGYLHDTKTWLLKHEGHLCDEIER